MIDYKAFNNKNEEIYRIYPEILGDIEEEYNFKNQSEIEKELDFEIMELLGILKKEDFEPTKL